MHRGLEIKDRTYRLQVSAKCRPHTVLQQRTLCTLHVLVQEQTALVSRVIHRHGHGALSLLQHELGMGELVGSREYLASCRAANSMPGTVSFRSYDVSLVHACYPLFRA